MPRNAKPASRPGFYEEVLDQARRNALRSAKAIDSLDDDIALLRACVYAELAEAVVDRPQVLRTLEVICKAELARARISGRSGDDLYKSVIGVLHGVGEALDGTGGGDD